MCLSLFWVSASYIFLLFPCECPSSLPLCSLPTSFCCLFTSLGPAAPFFWSFSSSLFCVDFSFPLLLTFLAFAPNPCMRACRHTYPSMLIFPQTSGTCHCGVLWGVWLLSRDLSALPSLHSTSWLRPQQPRSGWLLVVVWLLSGLCMRELVFPSCPAAWHQALALAWSAAVWAAELEPAGGSWAAYANSWG